MDPLILNFNDSLIYESDLSLLNEGNWLNDRIIGFVCDYFENEIFKNESDRNLMAFINPSTVQYLKLCEDIDEAAACFLEPLNLKNKEIIFLPLNSNQSVDAGGTHWSFLVIENRNSIAKHFDSVGSNIKEAESFYKKYKKFFNIQKLESLKNFPKQINSSDCGAYVIAGIELIAEYFKQNSDISEINFGLISPNYIRDLRKKYKNLILLLSSLQKSDESIQKFVKLS